MIGRFLDAAKNPSIWNSFSDPVSSMREYRDRFFDRTTEISGDAPPVDANGFGVRNIGKWFPDPVSLVVPIVCLVERR